MDQTQIDTSLKMPLQEGDTVKFVINGKPHTGFFLRYGRYIPNSLVLLCYGLGGCNRERSTEYGVSIDTNKVRKV